jgi:hypothetical protein
MTLRQDIQMSHNTTAKFEITGAMNADGTYQGKTLYKIDADEESKYWLGPNP